MGVLSVRLKSFVAGLLAVCLCLGVLPAFSDTAEAAMPYYITVDITNQIVTVYENNNRTREGVVRQMICSTGKSGHDTPRGTFTLPRKTYSTERTEWYSFPAYNCYAKWATRITGHILFHSILYSRKGGSPTSTSLKALGSKASHGCVRLRPDDAKWIALNCAQGTQCHIYKSGKLNSDLRKRLLKRSFSRSSQSYYTFLGINSKIPLKKGSGGSLVKQLQTRLKALGYFRGTIGGNFLSVTEQAVRYFQKEDGRKQNGVVNKTLWNRIFATDAPVGAYITLSSGMSGPAVSKMQRALKVAKCYSGSINGKFNTATLNAVKKWQKVRGSSVTGKATAAQQKSMFKVAEELLQRFGDQPYELVAVKTVTPKAKVALSKATLYQEASTGSKKLLTLSKDAKVTVLAEVGTWLQVKSGSTKGYMRASWLTRYDSTKTTYKYQLAEDAESNAAGSRNAALPEEADAAEDLGWAVVGGKGAALCDAAEAGAAVLNAVPANTVLCVLGREDGWIRVSWQGESGFIAVDGVRLAEDGALPEVVTEPEPEPEPEPQEESGAEGEAQTGVEGLVLEDDDNAVVAGEPEAEAEDAVIAAEDAAAPEADGEVVEDAEAVEPAVEAPVPESGSAEPACEAEAAEAE